MNKENRPFDPRIREIRGEVKDAEQGLCEAGEYLADLPAAEQAKAVAAMQKVFDAGVMVGEHKHTPVMSSNPDHPLIGPELKAHLQEAKVVQTEMQELRTVTQQILQERSKRYARSEVQSDLAA